MTCLNCTFLGAPAPTTRKSSACSSSSSRGAASSDATAGSCSAAATQACAPRSAGRPACTSFSVNRPSRSQSPSMKLGCSSCGARPASAVTHCAAMAAPRGAMAPSTRAWCALREWLSSVRRYCSAPRAASRSGGAGETVARSTSKDASKASLSTSSSAGGQKSTACCMHLKNSLARSGLSAMPVTRRCCATRCSTAAKDACVSACFPKTSSAVLSVRIVAG
mmetsp:Transcript_44649/g.140003  ORF Transcript_44649/g.140003 Transcript_44649/m.140003 type:complete len:222 (-) Transcript_44649:837-1502(-)